MFSLNVEKPKATIDYDVTYDFIALGLGPAGLNAGLYAKRKGLKTLVVGYDVGGQLINTSEVDNYLGLGLTNAEAVIHSFVDHIEALEVPMLKNVMIKKVWKESNLFFIELDNDHTLKAKTVLYALGGNPRKLQIPGEKAYASRGISYCVTCDAPFFANEEVVVAGGGNSAVDAAIDLARIAKKVTIIHRSQFRADQKSLELLNTFSNVAIKLETQILEVHGEDKITGLTILDKNTNKKSSFATNGLFIQIGSIPNSQLIIDLVEVNDANEVIVDAMQRTSLPGLYAAGDVTPNMHRQIVVAAAEGAKAALEAALYINKL